MASNFPDDGLPPDEDGDFRADLPFRTGGTSHPAHTEARAELRDRETYYAELRFAVHCQSRSIPAPRTPVEDEGTPAHGASAKSAEDDSAGGNDGTEGESWDDMIARFGDTWT